MKDRCFGTARFAIRMFAPIVFFLCSTTVFAQPTSASLSSRLADVERSQAGRLPQGTFESVRYFIEVADRIESRFAPQARSWRTQAARYLDQIERGIDPFPLEKGKITRRGYRSPVSTLRQGYAIYLPPDYDPSRAYPLMIMLHGGSSNGNLFLGVVLGNNMDWLTYNRHLWDDFTPRWKPNWIVVAADGFGQPLWRWMGERDVLDVMEDVGRHYRIDPNQIVLSGLSNGGVGAHNIGMRHAWRFSTVMAMAGAPSWFDYAGGGPRADEASLMRALSGKSLAENAFNTDYRIYHGRTDTGPMRPSFIANYERLLEEQQIPHRMTWYQLGHDILYIAHRHGLIYEDLAPVKRTPTPNDARVVTGDYRANRQHWLSVTRITEYPDLARVAGHYENGAVRIETRNASEIAIHRESLPGTGNLRVTIDGNEAYAGARDVLGDAAHFAFVNGSWRAGFLPDSSDSRARVKRPGLSGPITDAYYERMVHVYGTQDAAHTEALKQAARRGSTGWTSGAWYIAQEVIPDTEVTPALMQNATLVLYGTPGDNLVLDRIAGELPIRVEADAIVMGSRRFTGRDLGAKFIYPNPEAPSKYVLVQMGLTTQAVKNAANLPDFLPDYVVYNSETTQSRPRLISGGRRPLAAGFFDGRWLLPSEGADDTQPRDLGAGTLVPTLPIPEAPGAPETPRDFLAPPRDPAGGIAREIAHRVRNFYNFRAHIAGATWNVDPTAIWKIRPQRECLRAMRQEGVRGQLLPPQTTPVPTPVEISGPIRGVWFRSIHEDRGVVVSCEMALRLVEIANILRRHDVRGVDVMSSYRTEPRVSFHTMGLALDMSRFWRREGSLSVLRDFVATPMHATCQDPEPRTEDARIIRSIACDLAASHRFSSVLTPNYNEGHRDHFHVDIRPDDPRLFLR